MAKNCRIAADVGGTFTDIALIADNGRVATRKVLSTPDDFARGVIRGILQLLADLRIDLSDVSEVLHGCTVATNAILEQKGARTALVTTHGFRDVLELRRIRVPRLYDPLYRKPQPLVPRNRRFEVSGRIAANGEELVPINEREVLAVAHAIRQSGTEAVAVCLINSYANSLQERRVAALLKSSLPDLFVTASVDILPEIREYERTSSAVINAYVGPPVKRYLTSLIDGLAKHGIHARLLVMQSGGGMLDAGSAMEQPARIIECGPAAGVIGIAYHASRCGTEDVISFDMGGTTAKASLIESGQLAYTDEYEVGGGISLSSRLVKGGGYALKLPVIDISEVGAGGGSKVWFDAGGALKVGPESAGSCPGPCCYGLGGNEVTVTDAIAVLGYLNPRGIAGGSVPIHIALARTILNRNVAAPLGVPAEEAAWWIYSIATATMVRAVKAVSSYRGRNPADFLLAAFGGNGGIFAAELMRQLQIARAIVPPAAGVFSAIGLCVSDLQFSQVVGIHRRLSELSHRDVDIRLAELESRVRAHVSQDAAPRIVRQAKLRYAGQGFELAIRLPGRLHSILVLRTAFESEYAKTYGHVLTEDYDVEVVALEVTAITMMKDLPPLRAVASPALPLVHRYAYFGRDAGWLHTPVCSRSLVPRTELHGPWIIEDYESTTVIPPHASFQVDGSGNIVIELRAT